jgi:HAD superfamily hydrolase (TIGR01509 family)
MNFRALLSALAQAHGFTLSPEEIEIYAGRELETIIAMIQASAEPCINANPVLESLQREGKYGMAVVSSSALSRVQASLLKAGQSTFFDQEKVYSAATSLPTPTSKPDPAIYLHACRELGVRPEECMAVEDSKSGATAAVRAGIPVLGYVGAYEDEEEKKEIDQLLRRDCKALDVMWDWKDFRRILEKVEAM